MSDQEYKVIMPQNISHLELWDKRRKRWETFSVTEIFDMKFGEWKENEDNGNGR